MKLSAKLLKGNGSDGGTARKKLEALMPEVQLERLASTAKFGKDAAERSQAAGRLISEVGRLKSALATAPAATANEMRERFDRARFALERLTGCEDPGIRLIAAEAMAGDEAALRMMCRSKYGNVREFAIGKLGRMPKHEEPGENGKPVQGRQIKGKGYTHWV
jgi:hypothetical protein